MRAAGRAILRRCLSALEGLRSLRRRQGGSVRQTSGAGRGLRGGERHKKRREEKQGVQARSYRVPQPNLRAWAGTGAVE